MSPEAEGLGLICRIRTGQYTGDGTLGQAIIGVGFQPLVLFIYRQNMSGGWCRHDLADVGWIVQLWTGFRTAGIVSIDADGFTVTDIGGNFDPNMLNQDYVYLCLG